MKMVRTRRLRPSKRRWTQLSQTILKIPFSIKIHSNRKFDPSCKTWPIWRGHITKRAYKNKIKMLIGPISMFREKLMFLLVKAFLKRNCRVTPTTKICKNSICSFPTSKVSPKWKARPNSCWEAKRKKKITKPLSDIKVHPETTKTSAKPQTSMANQVEQINENKIIVWAWTHTGKCRPILMRVTITAWREVLIVNLALTKTRGWREPKMPSTTTWYKTNSLSSSTLTTTKT